MTAEIIAVGSELTNGAKLDTNSRWLSTELAAVGLTVTRHTCVADELGPLAAAFREAAARSTLVVVTGGLGPTLDDLTREALAHAAGVGLVLDEPSLRLIRSIFEARGRTMPERNVVQSMFPAGAEPIPNPRGTAPGIWFEIPRADGAGACRFAALPGVPSEMKPMFGEWVLPRLPRGDAVIRRYRVNCFGAGESAVEEKLGDLTARGREPEVGITAHEATITLRITATGPSAGDCDRQADETRRLIRSRLGDLVYGEEDEELQDIVAARLIRRGETVSVVETCLTGGRLTEWLTTVPESDSVFRGGLTVNTPEVSRALGLAVAAGSTHAEVARAAAEGTRRSFAATWALATVGDRGGGTGAIGLIGPDLVTAVPYRSFGDPAIDRSRAAKTALDLLRRRL